MPASTISPAPWRWDKDACNTLRCNHPELVATGEPARILEEDITDPKTHKKLVELFGNGAVDVIVGGPPCQSFSMLGTRSGKWVTGPDKRITDSRDMLFVEYVRVVKRLKPLFIVLENVDGIRSKKDIFGSSYLHRIISELGEAGYHFKIAEQDDLFLRLNAADYGVPQIRHRVFIVGTRIKGLSVIPPSPTHSDPEHLSATRSGVRLSKWVTLNDAIRDLPRLRARYTRSNVSSERWLELQKENSERRWCLDEQKHDEGPYHEDELLQHYQNLGEEGQEFLNFVTKGHGPKLRGHFAREQQESDIRLFASMPEGATSKMIFEGDGSLAALKELIRYDMGSFKDKYRKQQWSRPGTTVFAHLERDGNRFIHPDSWQQRTFTVREAARIQSFPDSYVFAGGMKSQFRQIGNAVPPLLARVVAQAIHETLQRGVTAGLCKVQETEGDENNHNE